MAQAKSIDELERDVVQARARVAADIALIRSPETYEAAKSNLMKTAFGYRDQMTDNVRDRATNYSDSIIGSLKAKAAANPLAVAAIGAGIAWRLYKHPPVMTVLVGLGLTSLLRTDPNDDSMHPRKLMEAATEKALEYKDRAAAQVQDLRENAVGVLEEKMHQATAAAEGAYENVKERAVALTASAREYGESTIDSMSPSNTQSRRTSPLNVPAPADSMRSLRGHSTAGDKRDAYLLGIAALAVGAAVGLARRGASDEADEVEWRDDDDDDVIWRRY